MIAASARSGVDRIGKVCSASVTATLCLKDAIGCLIAQTRIKERRTRDFRQVGRKETTQVDALMGSEGEMIQIKRYTSERA